ncbi:MAG: hypothetical protein OSB41_09005 [Kiritimatiellae bacterium]|nr:hypothetical protein [Kiritimatiellia bacterium]
MKRQLLLAALLVICAGSASAQLKDKYVVARESNFDGSVTTAVMTEKDFRAREKELRKEGFMATRARMMAGKAWDRDADKEGRFPASLIKTRRVTKAGRTYRERDEAENYAEKLNIQADKREAERKKAEERRDTRRLDSQNQTGKTSGRNVQSASYKASQKRLKERRKERLTTEKFRNDERDADRSTRQADAITIYEAQLEIIKNPPPKEGATR